MSRRKNLRIILADAIEKILGSSHELSIPNCIRYVKPNLRSFNVREQTDISLEDWKTAIELATLRMAKPIDQPQPLIKSRSLPSSSTGWREHLLRRLDKLLSEGVIAEPIYNHKRRAVQESLTKEQCSERLRATAIESGT